jgi:hypothetical protein
MITHEINDVKSKIKYETIEEKNKELQDKVFHLENTLSKNKNSRFENEKNENLNKKLNKKFEKMNNFCNELIKKNHKLLKLNKKFHLKFLKLEQKYNELIENPKQEVNEPQEEKLKGFMNRSLETINDLNIRIKVLTNENKLLKNQMGIFQKKRIFKSDTASTMTNDFILRDDNVHSQKNINSITFTDKIENKHMTNIFIKQKYNIENNVNTQENEELLKNMSQIQLSNKLLTDTFKEVQKNQIQNQIKENTQLKSEIHEINQKMEHLLLENQTLKSKLKKSNSLRSINYDIEEIIKNSFNNQIQDQIANNEQLKNEIKTLKNRNQSLTNVSNKIQSNLDKVKKRIKRRSSQSKIFNDEEFVLKGQNFDNKNNMNSLEICHEKYKKVNKNYSFDFMSRTFNENEIIQIIENYLNQRKKNNKSQFKAEKNELWSKSNSVDSSLIKTNSKLKLFSFVNLLGKKTSQINSKSNKVYIRLLESTISFLNHINFKFLIKKKLKVHYDDLNENKSNNGLVSNESFSNVINFQNSK